MCESRSGPLSVEHVALGTIDPTRTREPPAGRVTRSREQHHNHNYRNHGSVARTKPRSAPAGQSGVHRLSSLPSQCIGLRVTSQARQWSSSRYSPASDGKKSLEVPAQNTFARESKYQSSDKSWRLGTVIAPHDRRAPRQQLTARGRGQAAHAEVLVAQCSAHPPCSESLN